MWIKNNLMSGMAMDDEEKRLWQNFRDALRRLLEYPDLTPSQRNYILKSLKGFTSEDSVIDLHSRRIQKKE